MRRQLLRGAMMLVLVAATSTGAMAFDYGDGGLRAGIGGVHSGFHSGRFEGVRGFSGWRDGSWGSRRFVGGHGSYNGDYGPGRARFGSGFGQ